MLPHNEFKDNDNLQGEMLRMLLKRLIVIITRAKGAQSIKNARRQPPRSTRLYYKPQFQRIKPSLKLGAQPK